jgi:Zn-dependent protease
VTVSWYDEGIEFRFSAVPTIWIHSGIILLVAFITFPLWVSFRLAGIETAVIVAIGAILSLLAHELGHALTATSFGHPARLIRLHAGGGEAIWEDRGSTRWQNRLITIAGPATNLLIGLACLAIAPLVIGDPTWSMMPSDPRLWHNLPPMADPVLKRVLDWLGALNLLWATVNLLPAYPLDGGHLAHSFIASRWGERRALFCVGLMGTVLSVLSSLLLIVGVLAGMAIWLPPRFQPNVLAMVGEDRQGS